MSKQQTHILLDAPIYLEAKAQGINVSKICNSFLSEYLTIRTQNDDMIFLENEISRRKDEIATLQEQIGTLSIRLVHARENFAQQEKQRTESSEAMYDTIRNSGMLARNI